MEEGTQGPQATLGGADQEPPTPEPTEAALYIVQRLDASSDGTWIDIATVQVPPRTRRRSVLEKVLTDDPGWRPPVGQPTEYRVLDAQSFEAIPARMEPPEPSDPVLRIG